MGADIYGYSTGFVDYPNRLAMTLFFPGCNLSCPYCYNRDVVESKEGLVNIGQALSEIERAEENMNMKLGIVFSGGEPCVHPRFGDIVDLFQDRPLALHTNGLAPFPDAFDSIVLSLKTTCDGIRDLAAYREHMCHVLARSFTASKKELRVVNAQPGHSERTDTLLALADVLTEHSWRINIVEPFKRSF